MKTEARLVLRGQRKAPEDYILNVKNAGYRYMEQWIRAKLAEDAMTAARA